MQLKRDDNKCIVKCRICPEHKVRSKNYTVVVEVDEADEKILIAQCQDCVAAEGSYCIM